MPTNRTRLRRSTSATRPALCALPRWPNSSTPRRSSRGLPTATWRQRPPNACWRCSVTTRRCRSPTIRRFDARRWSTHRLPRMRSRRRSASNPQARAPAPCSTTPAPTCDWPSPKRRGIQAPWRKSRRRRGTATRPSIAWPGNAWRDSAPAPRIEKRKTPRPSTCCAWPRRSTTTRPTTTPDETPSNGIGKATWRRSPPRTRNWPPSAWLRATWRQRGVDFRPVAKRPRRRLNSVAKTSRRCSRKYTRCARRSPPPQPMWTKTPSPRSSAPRASSPPAGA